MSFSVKFLSIVLCTAAIGSMGISNNADAANPGATAKARGSAAPSPTVPVVWSPPTVPVFSSCSGGNQSCTTTAVCPQGMTIQSGWGFYIVPDGGGAAYGICGTASAACVPGTASCSVTTAISGCDGPGWFRQTALVAITCQ